MKQDGNGRDEGRRVAHHIETDLVNLGRRPGEQHGFINPPIVRGSTVLYPTMAALQDRKPYTGFRDRGQSYTYGLRGSPTMDALEEALTVLEGGEGTALVPSGLAAVTLALMTVAGSGKHLLLTDSTYEPTRIFCEGTFKRMGVETTYYDPRIGGDIRTLFQDNTVGVITESPGSNTFEIQDIPAITAACKERGIATIMDNTWATPLFFKPLDFGIDISLQAGTKYVGGHSDILMGSVTANADWWPRLRRTHDELGMMLGPDDMFLALRGLRTMGVRLAHHEVAALDMARWLETRPEVARVLHPALPSHPDHALWKAQFKGSSGLFAIVLNPVSDKAFATFMDSLTLFGMGYSWGGFESLAVPFSHRLRRTVKGFEAPGPCVRLSIGLENVADLKTDMEQAFDAMYRDN